MAAWDPILVKVDNPGPYTGDGNNTYLLAGSDRRACLIDAGTGTSAHRESLTRHLSALGAVLTDVLVTHGHADHASGAPALRSAFQTATFSKHCLPGLDDARVPWRHLGDGDRITVGESVLEAVHTPGHAPDHLAFWHGGSRTAFTGDLINAESSVLIAWSRGGDLSAYLASLERLLALEPLLVLPAHGPRVDRPMPLLRATIRHRRRRHAQVLDAVRRGRETVSAIAESIYDGVGPALMAAARENVRAHLETLTHEGLIIRDAGDERWRLA